jgi:hypothetical protein
MRGGLRLLCKRNLSGGRRVTMPRRITARGQSDEKLYIRRNEHGQFADLKAYKLAHRGNIKRRSTPEATKRADKAIRILKTGGRRDR